MDAHRFLATGDLGSKAADTGLVGITGRLKSHFPALSHCVLIGDALIGDARKITAQVQLKGSEITRTFSFGSLPTANEICIWTHLQRWCLSYPFIFALCLYLPYLKCLIVCVCLLDGALCAVGGNILNITEYWHHGHKLERNYASTARRPHVMANLRKRC